MTRSEIARHHGDRERKGLTMITEQLATDAARKFGMAERALKDLAAVVQKVCDEGAPMIGPVTAASLVGPVMGALGEVAKVHLAIQQYDPRPRPFDGDGK